MITVGYFEGTKRVGILVWSDGELIHALGGFDPGEEPTSPKSELVTVVTSDNAERVISGWKHPDEIREISGVREY